MKKGGLLPMAMVAGVLLVPAARAGEPVEKITYSISPPPFCGRCTSIAITVSSDGKAALETGFWAGEYRDWRKSYRRWRLAPGQFERFRDALASLRPANGSKKVCDAVDNGAVVVRWQGGGGSAELVHNGGREGECLASFSMLDRAPALLAMARVSGTSIWAAPSRSELRRAGVATTSAP